MTHDAEEQELVPIPLSENKWRKRPIDWLSKLHHQSVQQLLQEAEATLWDGVEQRADGRWHRKDPVMANDMPVLLSVWCAIEPAVAKDLLENWLDEQQPDGSFKNTPDSDIPCWPIVGQCVELVLDILPDPQLRVSVLPKLDAYLMWCFKHYDQRSQALPRWPTAEESIFPELYDPKCVTIDAAVLLLNELHVFLTLAENLPEYDVICEGYEQEEEDLTSFLKDNFWNPDKQLFCGYWEELGLPEGLKDGPVDITKFALVWSSAPPEVQEGIRTCWLDGDMAFTNLRVDAAFYSLLLRGPHNTIIRQIRRYLLGTCAELKEKFHENPLIQKKEWAALLILLNGTDKVREKWMHNIPKVVRWADGHGLKILAVLLLGCILLLAFGGLWYEHTRREGQLMQQTREYEARRLSSDGEHEEALKIYETFRPLRGYNRLMVAHQKMFLKRYADAEADYRQAIREMSENPRALLNLALSIYRQDRKTEALDMYLEIEEAYRYRFPEVSRHAAQAATLIEDQLKLDRPRPALPK